MQTANLAGQPRRLFDYLSKHSTADTAVVRRQLDIGNVSDVAFNVNARLALSGDPRRVVCVHQGRKATWCIETPPKAA